MVLGAMSTVTRSTDMDDFMRLAGLTLPEVLEALKELAGFGFVIKTKHGYAIVEKGKLALTALTPLPDDNAFFFYVDIGQPAGVSANSPREFYEAVKAITTTALEFHMKRGDFEEWLRTSVKDDMLANEFSDLAKEELKGEELRKQILLGLLTRFGDDVLLREWNP
jgi:hypothetical protein